MSHLVADDAMLAILNQAKDLTEIRDATGKVVGIFAPSSSEKARMLARAAAHVDLAEIQRRKEANLPGKTTREVFEHLKTLTQDEPTRAYLQSKIDRLAQRDACDTQ